MSETRFTQLDSGERIAWVYDKADRSSGKCAIMLHGFSSSKDNSTNIAIAPVLKSEGISVFRVDFMGCGESTGSLGGTTISSGVRDLMQSWQDCIAQNSEPSEIVLVASSFGAAVGLAAAKHLRFSSLSLKSPMLDIRKAQTRSRGQHVIAEWERTGSIHLERKSGPVFLDFEYVRDSDKYDFFQADYLMRRKILIVHGDQDCVAPYDDSIRFVSLDPQHRVLCTIPGAGHKYEQASDFEKMIKSLLEGV
jgi:pimeloyl-ACP methyl ester carboxylesterase